MKPGSLVMFHRQDPIRFGVILRKSIKYPDQRTIHPDQWWEVLCNNKIIIDMEMFFKLVE